MNKLWLVTRREYTYNLMRKSFLFAAFVMPVFIMGGMYLVILFASRSASDDTLKDYERVGYVDPLGFLVEVTEYRRFIPFESEASARRAFDTDAVDAYFVLDENYFQTGKITYYANKGLPFPLQNEINDFLVTGVASLAPPDVPLERLRDPVNSKVYVLGEEEALDDETVIGRIGLPIVFSIMFIFTVLTTSQFLMSGVVEEKENRIMEMLITSIRPHELLMGKVLGLGALALTQVFFWLAASLTLAAVTGRLDFISQLDFTLSELALVIVYFMLSFLLFAGIMVGIGASVTAEQESRQIASIFVLLAISPMWAIAVFLENPQGTIATAFSLFPLTSPITNLFLVAAGEARPWQIALSLLILGVSIVAVMGMAVRVFHLGMLMYGQRLSFKQIRRAVLGGQ